MNPKAMDKSIELAHRCQISAYHTEQLLKAVKKGGDGQGMKVVRGITRLLLWRAFRLWLRARLGI